jgi:hypothetical protein
MKHLTITAIALFSNKDSISYAGSKLFGRARHIERPIVTTLQDDTDFTNKITIKKSFFDRYVFTPINKLFRRPEKVVWVKSVCCPALFGVNVKRESKQNQDGIGHVDI